jgi:hypothetical protein
MRGLVRGRDKLIQNEDIRNDWLRCCVDIEQELHDMDGKYNAWKQAADRLWLESRPDWREAARLMAEIAGASEDETVRRAAAQALPVLRNASLIRADRTTSDVARRRLGPVRDALHAAAAPRFGRRGVVEGVTPEDLHRQMLGLPLHRRLVAAEIHQAFKRAAKTAHPDTGGNGEAFLALAEARDALMHPNKKGG